MGLFSASYSGFKTESEQYSTLRWKTPNMPCWRTQSEVAQTALVNEGRVLLIAARLHASLAQERILSKIDSSMICKK
jgi:hypothetical protein